MKIVQMVFPGGKNKAFTMSYDDGVIQDEQLVKLMNKYGIKGTFNLNSGFIGKKGYAVIDGFNTNVSKLDQSQIIKLYEGHEIACHGLTHMKLTDMDTAVVAHEIIEDRRNLERMMNKIISGFAYPFGTFDKVVMETLKMCGIDYARTVVSTGNFELPKEFLAWHPTCHHDDPLLMELGKKFCEEKSLFGIPQLFYLWGHAYEFDQKNNWENIEQFLSYIGQFSDTIWMATNGEICNYIKQFKKLKYSVGERKVYNPTAQDLWISIDEVITVVPAGKTITF